MSKYCPNASQDVGQNGGQNAGKNPDQNANDENYEEKQNTSFSNNFFYNTPKEYKASTLDWLAGQARI